MTPADVTDLVHEGTLKSYGGTPQNPFVRLAQVEQLAQETGRELREPGSKRRASQNPVRRVELRLRHDARWSEVSAEDIRNWVRGLAPAQRQAALQVARTTLDRTSQLIKVLTEDQPKAGS